MTLTTLPQILIVFAFIVMLLTSVNAQPASFESFIKTKQILNDLCKLESEVLSQRIVAEYGSMFAANSDVLLPKRCYFRSDADVVEFQRSAKSSVAALNGFEIELQEAAMHSLLDAAAEAESRGKRISPLDGSIAGKRSYSDTVRIWNSRFLRALDYWVQKGRIESELADSVRWQPFHKQAAQVLSWEAQEIYFSTNFSRSIFSSTAPPGTSQHLTMLAFDVVQYSDPDVRKILNDHGWYQTIIDDAPHFTFLGVKESELPSRGLKCVFRGSHFYWVPNLTTATKPLQTAAQ